VKQHTIDFLYLDLNTCARCVATDGTLRQALDILSGVLDTLDRQILVNAVHISSRELAEQYRFVSSPTIRVDGVDICSDLVENECADCGALCGDSVDCRVFVYNGVEYEQPPVPMLVEGILKALYGQPPDDSQAYALPENLKAFFEGNSGCCDEGCCDQV